MAQCMSSTSDNKLVLRPGLNLRHYSSDSTHLSQPVLLLSICSAVLVWQWTEAYWHVRRAVREPCSVKEK